MHTSSSPEQSSLFSQRAERAHQVVLEREAVAAAEERVRHAGRRKVAVPVAEELLVVLVEFRSM